MTVILSSSLALLFSNQKRNQNSELVLSTDTPVQLSFLILFVLLTVLYADLHYSMLGYVVQSEYMQWLQLQKVSG